MFPSLSRRVSQSVQGVVSTCIITVFASCCTKQNLRGPNFCSDADWLVKAQSVKINSSISVDGIEMEAARRLGSLGFTTLRDPNAGDRIPSPGGPVFKSPRGDIFYKHADLSQEVELVPLAGFDKAPKGRLDTIAIISIDRRENRPPYLYTTLWSLFREFPNGSHFNILVGNDNGAYVSPEALVSEFGPERASQLHVFLPPAGATNFLSRNFELRGRASWNYGRALRSYHGTSAFLLLEDDVVFSAGFRPQIESWLASASPPVISLYNLFCSSLPGAADDPKSTVALLSYPVRVLDWEFGTTQAMVYDASVARELGNYISVRLGKLLYDLMVDEWMRQHNAILGVSQPSMVQHIGRLSSGLGFAHESPCFAATFPTRKD